MKEDHKEAETQNSKKSYFFYQENGGSFILSCPTGKHKGQTKEKDKNLKDIITKTERHKTHQFQIICVHGNWQLRLMGQAKQHVQEMLGLLPVAKKTTMKLSGSNSYFAHAAKMPDT